MSQTTQVDSETTESSESKQDLRNEEQDEKLDFEGKIKKLGLGISVTAVGGAIAYAFGIVVIITVLVAILIAFGMYLGFRLRSS